MVKSGLTDGANWRYLLRGVQQLQLQAGGRHRERRLDNRYCAPNRLNIVRVVKKLEVLHYPLI